VAVTRAGFVGVGTPGPPGVTLGVGVAVLVGVPGAPVGVPGPLVGVANVPVAVLVAVDVGVGVTAVPSRVGVLLGVPTTTVLTIVTLGMDVTVGEAIEVRVTEGKGGGVIERTATGVRVPATNGLGCTICSTSWYHNPSGGSLPQPTGPG
jgi:hypothetical protein